jgi:hypothetical protein
MPAVFLEGVSEAWMPKLSAHGWVYSDPGRNTAGIWRGFWR